MAKEESFPVGIGNIAFYAEKMVHSCVHFLRNMKIDMFENIHIQQKQSYNVHFNMIMRNLLDKSLLFNKITSRIPVLNTAL